MSVPRTPIEALVEHFRAKTGLASGPRPSQSEQAIVDELEAHVEHESETLRTYGDLAASSPDPHVRYLAHLILDDEVYHHGLLTEMLDRVRSEARCDNAEPSIPWVRPPLDPRALLEATTRLMQAERDDLRRVRSLKRRLRPRRRTSLLWVIAEILEHDTRKHLRILEFLRYAAQH